MASAAGAGPSDEQEAGGATEARTIWQPSEVEQVGTLGWAPPPCCTLKNPGTICVNSLHWFVVQFPCSLAPAHDCFPHWLPLLYLSTCLPPQPPLPPQALGMVLSQFERVAIDGGRGVGSSRAVVEAGRQHLNQLKSQRKLLEQVLVGGGEGRLLTIITLRDAQMSWPISTMRPARTAVLPRYLLGPFPVRY